MYLYKYHISGQHTYSIVKYNKLCYTYINFFNKTTLKCLLLLFISFLNVFPNIFTSFDQFLPYRYFVSKYPPEYLDISVKLSYQYIHQNPIFLSLACPIVFVLDSLAGEKQ